MNEQAMFVLIVALAAAVPGLAAFRLLKQREESQYEMQTLLRQQMQEQIDAQQRTIRFLTKRVDELEESRAREYGETELLRQETENLRQEVDELRRGVTALTRQIEAAEMTPAWSPPVKAPRGKAPGRIGEEANDLVALRQQIVDQFNLEGIGDLAFQLGIDFDELNGTTKGTKARALVNYLNDRDRVGELVELIRAQRPG